ALCVPEDFRRIVAQPYDIALVLLGDKYLQACAVAEELKLGGPALMFCGLGMATKLPRLPNLSVVTLSNTEAKRFSCGLVGLKGELAARILGKLVLEPGFSLSPKDRATEVLAALDATEAETAVQSSRKAPKANPRVDIVIHIPQPWWERSRHQK